MTDIKLLTEAEVRGYFKHNPCAVNAIIESFRERGLIAKEPVDLFLKEAREIVGKTYNWSQRSFDDDNPAVASTLAALRRGTELQREKLTREVVREVVWDNVSVINGSFATSLQVDYDTIHAALLERLS